MPECDVCNASIELGDSFCGECGTTVIKTPSKQEENRVPAHKSATVPANEFKLDEPSKSESTSFSKLAYYFLVATMLYTIAMIVTDRIWIALYDGFGVIELPFAGLTWELIFAVICAGLVWLVRFTILRSLDLGNKYSLLAFAIISPMAYLYGYVLFPDGLWHEITQLPPFTTGMLFADFATYSALGGVFHAFVSKQKPSGI